MSKRPEKIAYLNELRSDLGSARYVIVSDYRGLTVTQMEELRRRLLGAKSRMRIVKNSLLGLVAREMSLPGLTETVDGPTAMVFGAVDVVGVAKVLRDFIKDNRDLPAIKCGVLENVVVTAADVLQLAKLPAKPVLQAMLVGTLAAPMTGLVGVLQQKVASLLYVLQAAVEKKEKEQGQTN